MKLDSFTTRLVGILLLASAVCLVFGWFPLRNGSTGVETTNNSSKVRAHSKHPSDMQRITPRETASMTQRLQALLGTPTEFERSRRLLEYSLTFKAGDWQQAMTGLKELGYHQLSEEYLLLLSAWAAADPLAAINSSDSLSKTVLPIWMENDPDAALTWIRAVKHLNQRETLLIQGLVGLVHTDLQRVIDELAVLTEPPPNESYYSEGRTDLRPLASAICELEPAAIENWLNSLSPSLRSRYLPMIVHGLGRDRFQEVIEWMKKEPQLIHENSDSPYRTWAEKDADAAHAAYTHLEPGALRSLALDGLVDYFRAHDPERSLDLIQEYPLDRQQNELKKWINLRTHEDPARCLELIPQLQEPAERERRYTDALSILWENDPAAATKWLNENEVPDGVRQAFAPVPDPSAKE